MARRYLFNCPECNFLMELGATQAGQQLTCSKCNAQFEAPKLGVLKQRPVSDESESVSAGHTQTKRTLFSGGLLLAAVAGLFGAFLYWYGAGLIVDLDLDGHQNQWVQTVDQMSPEELLENWKQMDFRAGLGEWREQIFARYRTQGQYLQYISFGMMGLSGIGLLMMVSSFAIKS